MLTFIKGVTVRFHPFNPHNGTARQFLAQCNSPAYFKKVWDRRGGCGAVR